MGNKTCCDGSKDQKQFEKVIHDIQQYKQKQQLKKFLQNHLVIASTLQELRSNINQKQYHTYSHMMEDQDFFNKCQEYQYQDGIFLALPEFQGKQKNGFGIMLYNQRKSEIASYYQGYWSKDMRDQWGIFISDDADFYVGRWKNDEPNGKGHYKSEKNKVQYFGQWSNGFKNGKGKQIYPDNSFYEGQFKDNLLQGQGIFKSKSQRYEGTWKNGLMDGVGKTEWYDQNGNKKSCYMGEYKQGKKHGFGQYVDSKGVIHKAIWQQGQIKQNCPRSRIVPTE